MIDLEIAFMRIRDRWYRKQEKAQEQKKSRGRPRYGVGRFASEENGKS
jgi:hypothetical protein